MRCAEDPRERKQQIQAQNYESTRTHYHNNPHNNSKPQKPSPQRRRDAMLLIEMNDENNE